MAACLPCTRVAFDDYAKSQSTFADTVARLAADPCCADLLHASHAVQTVRSLAVHGDAAVRATAVLALARLASHSRPCAQEMLDADHLLSGLFEGIVGGNKNYKTNTMHLIINLSKHSSEMSDEVIKKHRGIIAILTCLMDVDLFVKEVAFRTINTIVCHNANFSQFVANFNILPKIVLCLKEQQPNLKLHTLSTLNELAKCNQDLAWKIVNLSVLPDVMDFLSPSFTNIQIQRISLNLIKNIVKHSLSLTKKMIESHLFPNILLLMAHPDESIRNNSAKVVHNIVEHDIQITEMVITTGGIVSLLNVISCRKKFSASSAILALGHIAAMSPLFASAVIQSKALKHLTAVLESNTDNNNVKGDVAWTLGMIGQHSSKHSNSVRACDAVTTMINIYMDASVKNKIKDKCKTSIQLVLSKCDDFTTLENLLSSSTSADIISCILDKISKTLLKNVKARRSFIENGYLKMIQNFEPEIDSELFRAIKAVKCCFPDDIIQMVAGGFPESIMKKVDKCIPKNRCT